MTKGLTKEEEREFDKIYNDQEQNIVGDLRLKDFTSKLLAKREREVLERVKKFMEEYKRKFPDAEYGEAIANMAGFLGALNQQLKEKE